MSKSRTIMYLTFVSLISYSIIACGTNKKPNDQTIIKNPYNKIKGLSWILGSWESNSEAGLFTETWAKTNDSVYTGKSVGLGSGKDTLFVESITIEQRGGDLFYIPVVKDQNDGKPVLFISLRRCIDNPNMNEIEDKQVVFVNSEHDFPKKISYALNGDSLIAKISGTIEGKNHTEKFPMVRAK